MIIVRLLTLTLVVCALLDVKHTLRTDKQLRYIDTELGLELFL